MCVCVCVRVFVCVYLRWNYLELLCVILWGQGRDFLHSYLKWISSILGYYTSLWTMDFASYSSYMNLLFPIPQKLFSNSYIHPVHPFYAKQQEYTTRQTTSRGRGGGARRFGESRTRRSRQLPQIQVQKVAKTNFSFRMCILLFRCVWVSVHHIPMSEHICLEP